MLMYDDIMKQAKGGMTKAIDSLKRELTKVRTGRASISLPWHISLAPTPLVFFPHRRQ